MYIKGFEENLICRDFKFEIGKEYKIELPEGYQLTKDDLCSSRVFHFCDNIRNVLIFYPIGQGSRFCEIEVLGQLCSDGTKMGSNHIKIVREIKDEELDILLGRVNGNTGLFNTGLFNSGDWNSGDWNSGDWNSGDFNSGSYNIGCYNSGYSNSGGNNSGHYNAGLYNSGDYNSGWHNSGHFNSCNNSSGVFCNIEPTIRIFNMETDMTMREFILSRYWSALHSSEFNLENKPYEIACQEWWKNMTEENKKIIKSMPNFDIDIFCDITGIDREDV